MSDNNSNNNYHNPHNTEFNLIFDPFVFLDEFVLALSPFERFFGYAYLNDGQII